MTNTLRQQVVTLLTAEYPGKLSQREIADYLGANRNTLRRTMSEMENTSTVEGYLAPFDQRPALVVYSIPTPSPEAINNARAALGYMVSTPDGTGDSTSASL